MLHIYANKQLDYELERLARLADISQRAFMRLSRDRNSHIYQHLQQSQACWGLANKNCFSIVDCAPNKLGLYYIILFLLLLLF